MAALLETTTTAVHSGVRRARAELAQAMPDENALAEPDDAQQRATLERYVAALTAADASALAELLRADVVLEMPPLATWFAGADVVTRFVGTYLLTGPGDLMFVPVGANGQPALAVYNRGEDGLFHGHAIHVLTIAADGIARIVAFSDPAVFAAFDLPAERELDGS